MDKILQYVVENIDLHVKWLNTLSFLENVGARKISACEQPHSVSLIQLKHAAEEHRHAYYLKKQINKIDASACPFYEAKDLLAARETYHYLNSLDMKCARFLKKEFDLTGDALKYAAYLFVTYAIEVRADALYPIYQDVLTRNQSKVMVKSIIIEEEGHLEEMIQQLERFHPNWQQYADKIVEMETELHANWFSAISKEVLEVITEQLTIK